MQKNRQRALSPNSNSRSCRSSGATALAPSPQVQEALDQPLAYTTVQTMLNILNRKGKLKRELRGRAFVYKRRGHRGQGLESRRLRDLIDRMFGGSSEELVMSLLKSRQIDAKNSPSSPNDSTRKASKL